ncbi:cardiolipin synthase [Bacillus massilinigeriensis]|uniref:cardiolipin synthase n=1 Tax=Bacillus mediterraneensis TaxID=1805474 RepID=UPI0008F87CF4|nr:cardiolipin synthase [Bacillus mediterraneensis]
MLKRRVEFMFVPILLLSLYIMLFTYFSFEWKLFFSCVYSGIILFSIFSLLLENRSPNETLVWMYVLIFFPVLGYGFYLFSGQLYLKGYLFKNKRSSARAEWERMMRKEVEPDLSFLKDNQLCFAKFAKNTSLTPITIGSCSTVLRNGEETFADIMDRIEKAENFIHIEYYIFRSDRLGRLMIERLISKAKEGVEVLFIYDAAGSLKFHSKDTKKMEESGIRVYPFSPLKYGFFNQKFNFRNHRKIIIIDGEVGFVGGLNVGMEYLGLDENIGYWRDTHLLLEGEAVYSLHNVFLLDWEYVSGEKVMESHRADKERSVVPDDLQDGAIQVVASGPDTQQGIMSDLYFTLMSCAKQSIWIATPYFIPDEAIRTALRTAAAKGIQVRVLVPEKNDSFLTQYASESYFSELLRYGVEIYSYKKGFLHQKVVIVDGNLASVGTANMDMRSFHLNFEVNVFLYGCPSIQDLVDDFEEDITESNKIGAVEHYKRGFGQKIKESVARLFSGVL